MEYILTGDYIPLIKLLKTTKIAQTGGHAKILVEEGSILVNGMPESRKRAKIKKGDIVKIHDTVIEIR